MELKHRCRTIENAKGFDEAWNDFRTFLLRNNFGIDEVHSIIHLINSFYFMGEDVENFDEK